LRWEGGVRELGSPSLRHILCGRRSPRTGRRTRFQDDDRRASFE